MKTIELTLYSILNENGTVSGKNNVLFLPETVPFSSQIQETL